MREKQSKKKMKKIDAASFFEIKEASQPAVSPDGKRIAYVVSEVDRIENKYALSIWVSRIDGRKKSKKFTAGGTNGDMTPVWSPTGEQLAFVSTRAGKPQIFIIDIDGGEAVPFTSMPNGAFNPAWSPDGKYIAFLSRVRESERLEESKKRKKTSGEEGTVKTKFEITQEEERKKEREKQFIDPRVINRMVFRRDTEFWDERRLHVYVKKVNGETGERRITDGDFDFGPPSWTTDSKSVLTFAHTTGNEDVEVRVDILKIPRRGGKPETLVADGNANVSPVSTPGSENIIYISFLEENVHEQNTVIRLYDAEKGCIRDLTYDLDRSVTLLRLSRDGKRVFFNSPREGRVEILSLDIETGKAETIVAGDRFMEEFDVAGDMDSIAYRVCSPTIPSDIFFCNPVTGAEERLSDVNSGFNTCHRFSLPEEIWFEGAGGRRTQGWIMKPAYIRRGKKIPLVVQVHGGPHIMWGYSFWHEFQAFVSAGYAVFFCNPRGSDGYGRKSRGSIRNRWGEDDMRDILLGAEAVIDRGFVDPDNLFLTGGSFGGFMTAWIVGHDNRFKAAVAQRGVYNLVSLYGTSDAYQLVEWEFDSLPWKDAGHLHERSPLAYVERIETPLMIIHSEQDYRAGIATADELFVALRRLGKEAVMVRYPREGHELSRSGEPLHRVDRIRRMIAWFDDHRA